MRLEYLNGDPVGSPENGCDGCAVLSINGTLCHETGCPDSWRDADPDEPSNDYYLCDGDDCAAELQDLDFVDGLCADCTP